MANRIDKQIRITGGSWWCSLCNEFHCEGGGCPRLPLIKRPVEYIKKDLREAARKVMEMENTENGKGKNAEAEDL